MERVRIVADILPQDEWMSIVALGTPFLLSGQLGCASWYQRSNAKTPLSSEGVLFTVKNFPAYLAEGGLDKCFLMNARPDPDLRYFSNSKALYLSSITK